MSDHIFHVAGVQFDIKLADVGTNLEQIATMLGDPQLEEAGLVVFPECATTGYCFQSRAEAAEIAEPIPGPITRRLVELARQHDQHLAVGMLERDDRALFNSCVLVGPAGVEAKYRKLHLPHFGVDRFVTAGDLPPLVHQLGPLRIGIHICYDSSFPELARVLTLQGADLLILPTNWPDAAVNVAAHLPYTRAIENHVYYLVVNRVGEEAGQHFIGQSRLCSPFGDTVDAAQSDRPDIVVGAIDVQIARSKRLVRQPGPHVIDRLADRRPEWYTALLDPREA